MVRVFRALESSFGDGCCAAGQHESVSLGGEPVNINLASAEAIAEALSGVGLAKANRIVEYREAYGPFEHVDELAAVRGIGQATVEKNRDAILLR